jgi:nicotinate-nucleotide adenylyltransferase
LGNRVGIFGGSFDPVHNGHISVVKSFLKSGLIDEVLVLLTPNPPHKNSEGADYEHRLKMLKLAFRGMDKVVVSDLERKLPSPSYTVQTIEYLQKKNPDTNYFYCLGEDSIKDFQTWHRYSEILEMVSILVAERPGFSSEGMDDEILERTIFVDHEPIDMSSTKVRNKEIEDRFSNLPASVKKYIHDHNLYQS